MNRKDLRPIAAEIQKILVSSGALDTEGMDQKVAQQIDALIAKQHPKHAASSAGYAALSMVLAVIRAKQRPKAPKNLAGAMAAQMALQLYNLNPTLDVAGDGSNSDICDAIALAMQDAVESLGVHLEAWQDCVDGSGNTSSNDSYWDLQVTDDGVPSSDFPIGVEGCEAHWERAQGDLQNLEYLTLAWNSSGCGD